jgi:Na+/melibiose symporter-like transporter
MNSTEVIQSANVIEVEDRKLKFSEKLAAQLNSTTGSFHSQVIQMFLLFYYTDILKISAAYMLQDYS